MSSVRPEHSSEFWETLAQARWRRVRWRREAEETAVCVAFGTPIHRRGTYYVRPAYTDGQRWLSQQGYDAMIRHTRGTRAARRTGTRPR